MRRTPGSQTPATSPLQTLFHGPARPLQINATIVDIPFQHQHEQGYREHSFPSLVARRGFADAGRHVDVADADVGRLDGRAPPGPGSAARARRSPGDQTG